MKNDKETKDVNLNNIANIDERTFCEIFDGLRTNDNLVRLSAANCDVNDFAGATLNLAIETNQVGQQRELKQSSLHKAVAEITSDECLTESKWNNCHGNLLREL